MIHFLTRCRTCKFPSKLYIYYFLFIGLRYFGGSKGGFRFPYMNNFLYTLFFIQHITASASEQQDRNYSNHETSLTSLFRFANHVLHGILANTLFHGWHFF